MNIENVDICRTELSETLGDGNIQGFRVIAGVVDLMLYGGLPILVVPRVL